MKRLSEPSTWAGIGLVSQVVPSLIASGGKDVQSWAALLAGIAAILKKEAGSN